MVDLLLGCPPQGKAFDQQQADELFAAAESYYVDPASIQITIAEQPADQ